METDEEYEQKKGETIKECNSAIFSSFFKGMSIKVTKGSL